MNEKIARQIEEMKKQTIGVEVEMNNIARDKAARTAAKFFGTGRYESTAGRNGYSTWSAWDAQGREWKFQKDVSITGPDSEKCELVTPILTYSDIETLADLQGKTFAFVDPESASGNVVPCNEILNAVPELGLTFDDLHTDGKFFKSAMFAGSHAGSMQAVIQGNVDAAAVSSSTYENQIEAGNAQEGDLKIIHKSPTIPGSPIAIQKDLPQELKDKVKDFLLSYDNPEYFGDEEGKEPERFIAIEDSAYDYIRELKEKYNLSD